MWLIPVRLALVLEYGLRRLVEPLLVRRPERVGDDDDRKCDQIEQTERLREPDCKIMVHDQPPAACLWAASVSLPRICRYAISASSSVSSPGLPSKARTFVAAP